jgi:hypothetical protein
MEKCYARHIRLFGLVHWGDGAASIRGRPDDRHHVDHSNGIGCPQRLYFGLPSSFRNGQESQLWPLFWRPCIRSFGPFTQERMYRGLRTTRIRTSEVTAKKGRLTASVFLRCSYSKADSAGLQAATTSRPPLGRGVCRGNHWRLR